MQLAHLGTHGHFLGKIFKIGNVESKLAWVMVLLKMQSDIVSKKILQTAPWGLHYTWYILYILFSWIQFSRRRSTPSSGYNLFIIIVRWQHLPSLFKPKFDSKIKALQLGGVSIYFPKCVFFLQLLINMISNDN